ESISELHSRMSRVVNCRRRKIIVDLTLRLAIAFYLAVRKVNYSPAQRLHSTHIVADEQHSPPLAGHVFHFRQALFLETSVTDCQNLVYQQDVSLQMRRNSERQSHIHARRVMFH